MASPSIVDCLDAFQFAYDHLSFILFVLSVTISSFLDFLRTWISDKICNYILTESNRLCRPQRKRRTTSYEIHTSSYPSSLSWHWLQKHVKEQTYRVRRNSSENEVTVCGLHGRVRFLAGQRLFVATMSRPALSSPASYPIHIRGSLQP